MRVKGKNALNGSSLFGSPWCSKVIYSIYICQIVAISQFYTHSYSIIAVKCDNEFSIKKKKLPLRETSKTVNHIPFLTQVTIFIGHLLFLVIISNAKLRWVFIFFIKLKSIGLLTDETTNLPLNCHYQFTCHKLFY